MMTGAFSPKVVAPGEGTTVKLFGVRFGYKVVSADSGAAGVGIGDQVLSAEQGSWLVKPRGTPHAMWNAASEPATVIEIVAPGGLEGYFEKLAPILADHRTPPEYYQLAEDYGITIQDD